MNFLFKFFVIFAASVGLQSYANDNFLLEAEHFTDYGGWVHDSQFMDQMGSPFLLAHGLGVPVKDAETSIELPADEYRIWVRTRDWCAPWKEQYKPGDLAPGRFQILINGKPLQTAFGTEGEAWHWQNGGTITKNDFQENRLKVALHDLTGFDGRIDAIYFQKTIGSESDKESSPPNDLTALKEFRKCLLALPDKPEVKGTFDIVVVGGGIAGTCAAISAARSGLKVALIQDRPVLGGNNSSEVRVWLHGARNLDPLPNIGNVVEELEQEKRAHEGAANTADIYEDERKLELVKAEKNISLFLEYRVNEVVLNDNPQNKQRSIKSIIAQQTKTGRSYGFDSPLFVDATGDGCVGFLAGADYEMTVEEGHMGRCNLWNIIDTKEETTFPRCPWAVDLTDKPFQGRGKNNPQLLGTWEWESGFYLDPIEKSEYIRDLNFRACYGAWDALKNVDKAFPTYKLNWLAHIAGKRESRRLLGDVVLDKKTVLANETFEDACVPTGWTFDLHLPNKGYNQGQKRGDEFLSIADHTRYKTPYWLPYRIMYSRSVDNLFMAGRDVSVSHEALGTVRVMRTGGCMGESVGLAASLCKKYNTTPRGVYKEHLAEFKELVKAGVPHSPDFAPRKINKRVDNPNGWAGFSPPVKLPLLQSTPQNAANKAAITVSSNQKDAVFLNDGTIDWNDNAGRWISSAADKPEIVFKWKEPLEIGNIRIVSGYNEGGKIIAPLEDFTLFINGQESAVSVFTNNIQTDFRNEFPKVKTNELRLRIDKTKDGRVRIWEVEIY
ncbi:MAG: FAD-dependent oxidoreductase [Planctomycetaceae bacterium]|jgi:hypothetical protein|nr:FAD-dependent oxidoreductase [Planctomycetaceae bacterium]